MFVLCWLHISAGLRIAVPQHSLPSPVCVPLHIPLPQNPTLVLVSPTPSCYLHYLSPSTLIFTLTSTLSTTPSLSPCQEHSKACVLRVSTEVSTSTTCTACALSLIAHSFSRYRCAARQFPAPGTGYQPVCALSIYVRQDSADAGPE